MSRKTHSLLICRSNEHLGNTLLRIAAVYLLIGLLVGLVMGAAGEFSLSSVHAHVSLLGWATMSITALVYVVKPACRESKLALLHFWGHNLGLPIMMLSLVLLTNGFKVAETMVACSSLVVIASLVAFSVNVFRNGGHGGPSTMKASEESDSSSSPSPERAARRYEHRRDSIWRSASQGDSDD